MGAGRYILHKHQVVEEPDLLKWGRWIETHERRVSLNYLAGDVKVSTVFLGLDHRFGEHGPPLVFETMIFGGELDGYQTRSSTWDEALLEHAMAVDSANKSTGSL